MLSSFPVDLCHPDTQTGRVCSGRSDVCTFTVTSFSMATGEYEYEFACGCNDDADVDELVTYTGVTCDVASCNGTHTCYNGGTCRYVSFTTKHCTFHYPTHPLTNISKAIK